MSSSAPPSRTRRAVRGARPSSTSVVITAAGSKYTATSPPCPKRVRKDGGENGRDQTVKIGCPGAHGDQREHVRATVDNRRPGALEKCPYAPEHYRSRERQLDPYCESF